MTSQTLTTAGHDGPASVTPATTTTPLHASGMESILSTVNAVRSMTRTADIITTAVPPLRESTAAVRQMADNAAAIAADPYTSALFEAGTAARDPHRPRAEALRILHAAGWLSGSRRALALAWLHDIEATAELGPEDLQARAHLLAAAANELDHNDDNRPPSNAGPAQTRSPGSRSIRCRALRPTRAPAVAPQALTCATATRASRNPTR